MPVKDLDWDLVRVLLAALRSPSLRQAAAELGVTHPTARKRLGDLEQLLGFPLFERQPEGYRPTSQSLQLLASAEAVEGAMQAFQRVATAADPELHGPIRVTLPEIVATDLLMDDLAAFCQAWPDIELKLEADSARADLGRREADVAIRFVAHGRLPDEHLAGRRAAISYRAVYGGGECWIGWRGAERDAAWVKQSPFPELPVRGAMNQAALQRAACAAGLGRSQLPCFFAEPLLKRITEPEPGYDIWVLVHEDLRKSPRLRVFRDAVVDALRRHRPRLEGRTAGSQRRELTGARGAPRRGPQSR